MTEHEYTLELSATMVKDICEHIDSTMVHKKAAPILKAIHDQVTFQNTVMKHQEKRSSNE